VSGAPSPGRRITGLASSGVAVGVAWVASCDGFGAVSMIGS
jgi:hypothetical protein